jgi:hydroxymethylpyrimidine/phosphomethylpyrimidine kinase
VRTVRRRRVPVEVHGTGCALASLIAGRLATLGTRVKLSDDELMATVRWATTTLARWLRTSQRIGSGMRVLGR